MQKKKCTKEGKEEKSPVELFINLLIKYNERKLVGIKGNHPLRLSIINLAIVKSTVKEKVKDASDTTKGDKKISFTKRLLVMMK